MAIKSTKSMVAEANAEIRTRSLEEAAELLGNDDVLFVDSETGAEIEADGRAMRAGYDKKFGAFLRSIESLCLEHETAYCRIITDEPMDLALSAFLSRRTELF